MAPAPVSLPEESHGQRGLVGYSPWGHKESDTTEQLSINSLKRVKVPCSQLTWAFFFSWIYLMQENYPSFIGLLFFTLVALKINYLLLRSIRPGIWKSLNVFTLLACVIFWLNFLYQKRLFSEYCFFHYTLSLKEQVKIWIMTTWGCQGCGRRDQGLKAICSGLKKKCSGFISKLEIDGSISA